MVQALIEPYPRPVLSDVIGDLLPSAFAGAVLFYLVSDASTRDFGELPEGF